MAAILQFNLHLRRGGWSPAEQAEFARVVAMLGKTGLPVACETGLSDEGDPWAVFVREDTGDVVAHVARIDGQIVAASAATSDLVAGPTFRAVMDRIVRTQPLVMPPSNSGDRLHLHPAAVFVAFIATALAWTPDEDVRPEGRKWKLLDDGTLALAEPQARSGPAQHGLLRDALLSKAEAGRFGLETAVHHVPEAMVIAVVLAAVAAFTKTTDLWAGDDTARAMSESSHADDVAMAVLRQDFVSAPDGGLTEFAVSVVSSDPAASLGSDEAAPAAPGHTVGPVEANPTLSIDGLHLDVALDATAATPTLSVVPSVGSAPGVSVLMQIIPVEDRREPAAMAVAAKMGDANAGDGSSTMAVDTSPAQPHSATSPTITISLEASELLSALFSKHVPFGALASMSWLGMTLGIETGPVQTSQAAQAQPMATPQAASVAAPETPPSTEAGYQLIEDILSFAFDRSHQLETTSLTTLQQALHDRIALPAGELVLIIDLPTLHNDIFHFSDGITMMAQTTAQKLMPDLDLQHAQTELHLADGTVLKLIGVVDLPHAGAAAA